MPETGFGGRESGGSEPCLHADRALSAATEAGLTVAELEALLRGRPPTEVVPPWPGEDPDTYADRATGAFMTLYLSADVADDSPPG